MKGPAMKFLIYSTIILSLHLKASHDHISRRIVPISKARLAHPAPTPTQPISIVTKPRTRTSELEKVESPIRNNIHSKSTGEIPSMPGLQNVADVSGSIHESYSCSFSPVGSPSTWQSSSIIKSQNHTNNLNSTATSKETKAAESNKHDEEIWRNMRFGHRKLQKSVSLPNITNAEHLMLSTSMTVAQNTRLAARAVYMQEQSQRRLTEQATKLEALKQSIASDSGRFAAFLIRFEGLLSRQETLISAVENMTHDVSLLAQRVAALEGMAGPASPRGSVDYSRNSIDASKGPEKTRHRTSSSMRDIRDMFGLGSKDN